MSLLINYHHILINKLPYEIISKIFLYLINQDAQIVKSEGFKRIFFKKKNLYQFMHFEFNWFYDQCCNNNKHYPCSICLNNYQFNQQRCNSMKYYMSQLSS